jgi:outer membrane protein OmpA-like peptidoglycan-associated protein
VDTTDRLAAEAEAKRKADEAAARKKAEDDARRAAEAEAKRKADEVIAKKKAEEAAVVAARKAEADKCQTAMRTVASAGVIQFERASAALSRVSHQTLDKLAVAANVCPTMKIDIEGYTDAEGTPERNQGLSERRAQSVLDYLVSAGVAAGRLQAIGYGEQRPVAPNDTPENRARNRRIEFSVKAD